ncbi:hypothetical protein [Treponema socranskii]|uniref:hypothetical protein n=1 Tax=Treponema socranskii TaxID=53419 RepID=UPI003D6DD53A
MEKKHKELKLSIDINTDVEKILSKKDKEIIIDQIILHFDNGKLQEVLRLSFYLLSKDQCYYFSSMKRKGFFRIGTKDFNTKKISYIIENILSKTHEQLKIENVNYLKSMLALHYVAPECRNILKFADNVIEKYKKRFIKTLYAILEFDLLEVKIGKPSYFNLIGDPIYGVDPVSEAISILVQRYVKKFNMSDEDFGSLNLYSNKNIISDFRKLIQKIIVLNKIQKIEYEIETYGYNFEARSNKICYVIPEEKIEKAKILTYFVTGHQHYNAIIRTICSKQDTISIYDLFKENISSTEYWKIEELPTRRIVIFLPFNENIKIFDSDNLFREEFAFLSELLTEFHIDDNNIKDMKLRNGISIFDVIKFKRIIGFCAYAINYALNKHNNDRYLQYESIVPVYSYDLFIDMLNKIYKDTEIISKLINELTWDKKNKFDIQTTPILMGGSFILFGVNNLESSNIFRNLCFKNHERIKLDEEILENKLSIVFAKKNFQHNKSIKFNFAKTDGDIDFIAKSDDIVFVAECKNSLYGSNIYEMKTNYDALEAATKQLSKIEKLFSDVNFRKYLSAKTNINIESNDKIVFFIVTGSRSFYGLDDIKYNIFPIYEFLNYIETHEIIFCNRIYSYYDDKISFSENLKSFINDRPNQTCLNRALVKINEKIKIGNKTIYRETFQIDLKKYYMILEKYYEFKGNDKISNSID